MKANNVPNLIGSDRESTQDMNKKKRFSLTDYFVLALTFTLLFSSVIILYHFQPYFANIQLKRLEGFGGQLFFSISMGLLAVQILFLLYIFYQYFKYKPVAPVSDEELPSCTVLVPAYNEGRLVYDTLLSLAQSDYPADKLEIISFDDGSKDDTWEWMQKAKAVLGSRVTIYQQPKNMGKRHALYRGFKLGKGEVFVTVDSDSIVKTDTLRQLVSPFVNNELCGAVGGNVLVLNTEEGIIPKMLNVSFVFSFEFIRSAQSALNTVLCTPGALAAYRREAVMNCLEQWITQTFMGNPSDIGEDRAMTNMILKQGYHVLFQKNAYVLTDTPNSFKGLYKMFIRWERSNVRENIMMSKFAFTKFRKGSTLGPRILLLNQWLKVIFAYPMMMLMLYLILSYPIMFVSSALAGILIFSSIQVIFYANKYTIKDSFWAYTYSIFYTFTLFWITPYAIATANRRGWLTRTLPTK
ncbi:glycosyltransferase family 2 protein [Myroides sp. NP-2]|uniref:glycosyltransferase n=1 Tax=Myroides sp. NP-2 TaxID=2759945 RepID=UPI0015FE2FF3|nr:glycosyltransferase [Myroides sp. NP-2]MBB1149700.1 glycosyltransferase family 2 protein [Myroides sp. NP-2]